MGLRINTNELALAAERNLGVNQRQLSKTMQRLATGSRIVEAADDPAGLAISDTLNAQIRSLNSAIKNAQEGVSLIQVYEGGTTQLNNMIIRMRELAMQSASDTVGDRERSMLNNEFQELREEITRVANTTAYSGKFLLNGDTVEFAFQVGPNNRDDVDRITFAPGNTDLRAGALGIDGLAITDKVPSQESLATLDEAQKRVNEVRSKVGSAQSRLEHTISAQGVFRENLSIARARIRDADIAEEATNMARDVIVRRASVAVLAQANETPALALQLLHM